MQLFQSFWASTRGGGGGRVGGVHLKESTPYRVGPLHHNWNEITVLLVISKSGETPVLIISY